MRRRKLAGQRPRDIEPLTIERRGLGKLALRLHHVAEPLKHSRNVPPRL